VGNHTCDVATKKDSVSATQNLQNLFKFET